jgi:cytochrome c
MKISRILAALLMTSPVAAWQPAHAEGDAARGKSLYEARCAACHSPERNRTGPMHKGVFGRKAGGVVGFDYSPALRRSTLVWNESTLSTWLADPEKAIPGQKMDVSVSSAAERADLVAYLRSLM